MRTVFALAVLVLHAGFGLAAEPADAVYRGGKIYTVDGARSRAEAVAIAKGRFVAVGSNAEIAAFVGPKTRVVELEGRMAMPGIHDMHAHPVDGGFQELVECSFPFTTPLDDVVARVRACAAKTPKGEWFRGGQWAAESLATGKPPTRALLDAAAPDHPVFLIDSTYHNGWVNSRALAKLGIDAKTPDPAGGVIVRDAGGAPTGILFDNATYDAMKRLPVRSLEQYQAAIRASVGKMSRLGVVAMKDALADGHAARAYAALDRAGKLDMRVATSRPWRASWSESREEELHNLEHWRDDQTPRVRTGFAKIFVDGIPPTRTAALLEPYPPDPKHPAGDWKGELQHSQADLDAALVKLDALGITVKMHATGDAALRAGLDAIAAARKANGDSGLRHEIAHAELASAADIPRFKPLGAIAELSPILWYPTPLVQMMAKVIGPERAARFWPIKTMRDQGVLLVYGSDWPSVVPSPSPWPGIEAMVTRRDPYGKEPGVAGPEQALPLADALEIFTKNGASALRLEQETGSIEVGKSADLIVLDRNLFEVPPEEISETVVIETVFEGRVVYGGSGRVGAGA